MYSVLVLYIEMAKTVYLMRLFIALMFFISVFVLSLIFTSFRILSSQTITGTIRATLAIKDSSETHANESTVAYVDKYDFWTKYYNDDRLGRSWDFNITQKYDVSQLHKYEPVVVKQTDVGRPGEMGKCDYLCRKLF